VVQSWLSMTIVMRENDGGDCSQIQFFLGWWPLLFSQVMYVDINTNDASTPTHNQISGPITRARARQLNNQVSSFLVSYSSYLDNGNMHSVLLLRNSGHEGNRVAFALATFRFQDSSSL
jgi:hypothetical protein